MSSTDSSDVPNPFESNPLAEEGSELALPQVSKGDHEKAPADLSVVLVERDESLPQLLERLGPFLEQTSRGKFLLIVFPKTWTQKVPSRARQEFFASLAKQPKNIFLAVHDRVLLLTASDQGISHFSSHAELKSFLSGHSQCSAALRHFSFEQWQRSLTLFLQRLRVLSSHRLSVTLLLCGSGALFLTVLFIALPSARIRVWPRMSLVSHTANVVLVVSGATLMQEDAAVSTGQVILPSLQGGKRNVLTLLPLKTEEQKSITFDEISKKFLGENAQVEMTFINEADEPYTFIARTRLVNQAGMVFRTLETITVPATSVMGPGVKNVQAEAQPEDLYGEMVGKRGNVPAGLKWEIPGLPLEERTHIYARNTEEATGGSSKFGTELLERDLELAQKQLEQELLQTVKMRTEEEIMFLRERTGKYYTILQYDVLTTMAFSGFVLPTHLVGESVSSIPLTGELSYSVLAYSKDDLLQLLLPGLRDHIEEGQELIGENLDIEGLSVHVIEYDDNLQWVKITAELTGKQRAVISAASITGREFSERMREAIKGKTVREAERIIQNFPEVESVEVSVWPPWRKTVPSLASNISLQPQK